AVDHRCDLFSLGSVLYHMSTGRPPFQGPSTLALLRALADTQPPSPRQLNPQLPVTLADLVMQLLTKDRAKRPQSAQAVAEALTRIERGPGKQESASPARRRWLPGAVAAAVLLLVLGGAGFFFGPAIYRFATDQGQLVLETDDPDVEVTVRGEQV